MLSTRLVETLFCFIHYLIKPLTDIHHPIGQFLQCLIYQSIGHLIVVGIGYGACDGSEGVCIAFVCPI